MKTIEEIAIESRRYHKDESFKTFNKELTFRMDDWAYGYCQGATEQKAIDDKECETMVGAAVREAQQVFVNKACEIYEKELRQMTRILNEVKNGAGDLISVGGSLIQFRKAMEENI